MISFKYLLISSMACFSLLSCSKVQKTEAEKEREEWIAGFTDSIDFYQKRMQDADMKLQDLNAKINSYLEKFEFVENPREVQGYYILKEWKSKIPFTTTSLYARINKNEKLELIATLAGATFNQIEVESGNDYAKSEIVPHDQAFNYRHERFNTVYFSGGKADTVALFINRNRNNSITLDFLQGNIKKQSPLDKNQKEMISMTWDLFEAQTQARELQKEYWISSKKIETFRRIMEMQNMENQN